jgi:hypothetical protein
MARSILVEQFHLSVRASRGLKESEYATIRQTLAGAPFCADLRRTVGRVVSRHAALVNVTVKISR